MQPLFIFGGVTPGLRFRTVARFAGAALGVWIQPWPLSCIGIVIGRRVASTGRMRIIRHGGGVPFRDALPIAI